MKLIDKQQTLLIEYENAKEYMSHLPEMRKKYWRILEESQNGPIIQVLYCIDLKKECY